MSAIGPGDHVECIYAPNSRHSGFQVGGVYIVSEVGADGWFWGDWLNCVGMPNPVECRLSDAPGWLLAAFRPVHRPTNKFMTALMQLAPKEPVPA